MQTETRKHHRRGFSLVELLVVITVVTLMLAILLPTLGNARNAARRSICMNNVHQILQLQLTYTNDSQERFPEHRDPGPIYVKAHTYNDIGMPGGNVTANVWYAMKSYVSNAWITICPLLTSMDPMLSDPGYLAPGGIPPDDYGAWDTTAGYVSTPYLWMPNFIPMGGHVVGTLQPEPGEQAWPKTLNDCLSDTPMVTHLIGVSNTAAGGPPPFNSIDWGHGGHGFVNQPFGTTLNIVSNDVPVGYGDGHAVIHGSSEIKARVTTIDGTGTTIYFY